MQVETRKVDGFPVVYHYCQVRPDFEDTSSNSHGARKSLNGEWSFRFDPKSKGLDDSWFKGASVYGENVDRGGALTKADHK